MLKLCFCCFFVAFSPIVAYAQVPVSLLLQQDDFETGNEFIVDLFRLGPATSDVILTPNGQSIGAEIGLSFNEARDLIVGQWTINGLPFFSINPFDETDLPPFASLDNAEEISVGDNLVSLSTFGALPTDIVRVDFFSGVNGNISSPDRSLLSDGDSLLVNLLDPQSPGQLNYQTSVERDFLGFAGSTSRGDLVSFSAFSAFQREITVNPTAVPEPGTGTALLAMMTALSIVRRARRGSRTKRRITM